jgi:hypothetical protein
MYSNAELEAQISRPATGPGYIRAYSYLLLLPEDEALRSSIYGEGQIRSAVQGSRMADGVYDAVQYFRHGNHDLPYTHANSQMLQREAARKTGPEPFLTSFGHLPHALS